MYVEDKIKEVEYNLNQIKVNYERFPEIQHSFSNFLSSANSIPDILLSDFATKFNMKIPLEIKSLRERFQKESFRENNSDAKKFYSWFIAKYDSIKKKDEIGSLLIGKRHVNIHRKPESPSLTTLFTFGKPKEGMPYMKMTLKNNTDLDQLKSTLSTGFNDMQKMGGVVPPLMAKVEWMIEGTDLELFQSCEYFLSLMKKFVSEANEIV
jgi:hypothetical protein